MAPKSGVRPSGVRNGTFADARSSPISLILGLPSLLLLLLLLALMPLVASSEIEITSESTTITTLSQESPPSLPFCPPPPQPETETDPQTDFIDFENRQKQQEENPTAEGSIEDPMALISRSQILENIFNGNSTFNCTALNNCTGHGTCLQNNTCECDCPFVSPDCSEKDLDMCMFNDTSTCNPPHGTCQENCRCECYDGWHGNLCEVAPSCLQGCNGNGDCINGVCKCHANWEGPDCSTDSRAKFFSFMMIVLAVIFGLGILGVAVSLVLLIGYFVFRRQKMGRFRHLPFKNDEESDSEHSDANNDHRVDDGGGGSSRTLVRQTDERSPLFLSGEDRTNRLVASHDDRLERNAGDDSTPFGNRRDR